MTTIGMSRAPALNGAGRHSTLAEVLVRIDADPTLSNCRRRELASALRKLCHVIGLPPESVPGDPRYAPAPRRAVARSRRG